eukprot:TRINITY_DN8324_c0_g1_i1.p1 TRINITY_DN8324_c0_g1~~TRINITY_DN8324_c0_g1_i1.p1  ORF type:complete len:257 (+),score=52.00 TRINITY_DN8324_c0_g1_i1:140-910(+)
MPAAPYMRSTPHYRNEPYKKVEGRHPTIDSRSCFAIQPLPEVRSPISKAALSRAVAPCRNDGPTPLQVYAEGGFRMGHPICDPTFQVLNQPHSLVDLTERWQSPASTFTEYLGGSQPCTASESLCRYVRARAYNKGEMLENQGEERFNQHWQPLMSYIEVGANLDHRDPEFNGFTALHHAAATGRAELVHFLIAQGANVDTRDYDGNKAVDAAREGAQMECMHILVHAKQVKNRIQRYNTVGPSEYAQRSLTGSSR